MCNFDKETSEKIFDKLIDMTGSYETREVFDHTMNFRTSKKKDALLNETINEFKNVGIRLSKNELINICVDIVLGIKQHAENPKHFYFSKNETTIMNFLQNNQQDIINLIKVRLFEEQMALLTKPYKTKKEKKNDRQQARRIERKIRGDN